MEFIKNNNIYIVKIIKTEIKNIDFATCSEPKQTLENYYNAQVIKPDIVINGGLFNFSNGKPVMDFIDEGIIKSSEDWIQYGFGIDINGNLLYGKDNDKIWKDFISAYPPLIVNGLKQQITIAQEIAKSNRRTILGYDDNFIYVIIINSPGATLVQAADIALNAGCKYAINLDGGGSTRLIYKGQTYAAAAYNRPVDNVVAIYLKPVIYRVQLGAFSSKQNAEKFCSQIQKIGAAYKNAYVRFIEPYYKVQVGAFSNKAYAESMVKDLKEKGYNAFITN